MRPFLLALGVLPLAGLTVGCTLSPADVGLEPRCPASGQVSDTIVLIAQAVPTAQLLPCLDPDALPNEWNVPDIDIRDGEARIDISAGEMDKLALRVTLRADCEIDGASPVPTDREGARRYDLPTDGPAELRGTRLYLFDGGCATYDYDLPSSPRQISVDQALLTVSLLPRHVVQDSVRVDHDDRLELDAARRVAHDLVNQTHKAAPAGVISPTPRSPQQAACPRKTRCAGSPARPSMGCALYRQRGTRHVRNRKATLGTPRVG